MIYSKYRWLISRKWNLVHWKQTTVPLWYSYTHTFISCSINWGEPLSLWSPSPPALLLFCFFLFLLLPFLISSLPWSWCCCYSWFVSLGLRFGFVEIESCSEAQAGLEHETIFPASASQILGLQVWSHHTSFCLDFVWLLYLNLLRTVGPPVFFFSGSVLFCYLLKKNLNF